MDLSDYLWLVAFVLLLVTINMTHHLFAASVRGKPLGQQSILDSAILDCGLVSRVFGSISCSVSILTRFQLVRDTLRACEVLLTTGCCVYNFAFSALCVNTG